MPLDSSVPSDSDLLSTHAAYIREVRTSINQVTANETADLLPALSTAANADTSPSVLGVFALKTANAGATLISYLDDGYEGQVVVIVAGDNNTSVQHDTGLIKLVNAENRILNSGDALILGLANGVWSEPGAATWSVLTRVTALAYTILVTDTAVVADGSTNAIVLSLPAANSVASGHAVKIKKLDADESHTISIQRSGGDLIDLVTVIELTLQNESVTLISDGISNWIQFN